MINLSKLKAYILITRPEIAVMDITLPAVCVFLASFSTQGTYPPLTAFVGAIAGAYLCVVASYVVNDTLDIDIDKINLPQRALPSGQLSTREALVFAALLYAAGLTIYAVLSWRALITVLSAIVIITLYSAYFKRHTPFSFLPVGLAYGLVPIMSWQVTNQPLALPGWLFAAMICITDWGFTLSGVARDVSGDREHGAPTLPVTWGIRNTAVLITICWFIGISLSLAIGLCSGMGYFFLSIAAVSGAWLLWRCVRFVRHPEPAVGGRLFLEACGYRGILFLAFLGEMGYRCGLYQKLIPHF